MFYGTSSYSQKMAVESFQLDETDLTAIQHGTIVFDQNGEKCALIIIETTHKPYTETFAVTDSSFTTIMPTFAKNYAEVTVITTEKAQIYDKDSLLGTGKWQGKLEAGNHTLIVKLSGHAPITKDVVLYNGQESIPS